MKDNKPQAEPLKKTFLYKGTQFVLMPHGTLFYKVGEDYMEARGLYKEAALVELIEQQSKQLDEITYKWQSAEDTADYYADLSSDLSIELNRED